MKCLQPYTTALRSIVTIIALELAPMTAFGQAEAESLSASFRKAAQRILPAVVTVRPIGSAGLVAPPLGIEPLEPVIPGPRGGIPRVFPRGLGGSGVVIDADKGFVLTNDHVVQGSPRIVVTLPDGRERNARQLRRDPRSDLALLAIEPGGLHSAAWGDSESLETGDWVLAIGQPFGLSGTVTAGIVSGKGRGVGQAIFNEDLIQTDAAINPGNSGGPLVNLKGEVVGINLAFKTQNGGYEGVGFAVPSFRAKRVAQDLADFGHVRRAYLGVEIVPLDPEKVEQLGQPGAVEITSVAVGSPASEAGLREGDVISKLEGHPVEGTGRLKAAIEFAPVGEPLSLTVVRDGKARDVSVRPAARPDQPGPQQPLPAPELRTPSRRDPLESAAAPPARREQLETRSPTRFPELGLRLDETTPELTRRFGLDPNLTGLVIVGVEPDGTADRAGLEVGMLITDVANSRVTSLAQFRSTLAKSTHGNDLIVRVVKEGRAGFRVLLHQPETKPAPTVEPAPSEPLGSSLPSSKP